MDRLALEQVVSNLVEDNTVHRVVHSLVEVCYRRVKLYNAGNSLELAQQWALIGRLLTQVEGMTHALDV
jgi:hypothetical protein